MRVKYISAVILSGVVILHVGWLIYRVLQPEVLPIGSMMPEISVETAEGFKSIIPDSSRIAVLIVYHPECRHCQRFFNEMKTRWEQLGVFDLYLLNTSRKDSFGAEIPSKYARSGLKQRMVSAKQISRVLGSRFVPSVYIFSKEGLLIKKAAGLAAVDTLLELLSGYRCSGTPES